MAGEPRFPRYGILDVEDHLCVVRFERHLAHPVEAVWAALTTPAALTGWWGEAELDLTPGGKFVMSWLNTDDEGNKAVLHGTITALEPPHLLEIGSDIHGVLRFELQPSDGGTHLRFSSTLQMPGEYRAKVLAGWHYHLDALATHLDGGGSDLVSLPGLGRHPRAVPGPGPVPRRRKGDPRVVPPDTGGLEQREQRAVRRAVRT
jgi:uncharacterized protein YndB with AHSA1/START domain